MKTTIELSGYEIVIEEKEGIISVSAMKDGESMEEFEVEIGEGGEESDDSEESEEGNVKDFDNFEDSDEDGMENLGGEEDDFDGGESEEDESEEDESEEDESEEEDEVKESDEVKLESFKSFIKKRK